MKKKLFSIIMCVLMVMCFMPTMTFAGVDEGGGVASGGNITWTEISNATDSWTGTVSTSGQLVQAILSNSPVYIKLMCDVSVEWGLYAPISGGKTVTIDLNGHNLTFGNGCFLVVNDGTLNIINKSESSETKGIVKKTGQKIAPIIVMGSSDSTKANFSNLNIENGVTIEAIDGIGIDYLDPEGTYGECEYGVVVNVDGKIIVKNSGQGIYVNKDFKATGDNVPKIYLGENSVIESDSVGINTRGYAEWTLKGNISAPNALPLKQGVFNISGGTYHSNGIRYEIAQGPSESEKASGAAICLASDDKSAQKLVVNISGGTFTSDNSYALLECISQSIEDKSGNAINPAEADATKSYATLSITGGTFKGAAGADAVKIAMEGKIETDAKRVITAGTFSTDPTDYVKESSKCISTNGSTWTVAADHTWKETAAVSATCTANGNHKYYTCIKCGKIVNADKSADTTADAQNIPATGHGTLTKVDGKTATCTEDGWKDYYKCNKCQKLFDAQTGGREITKLEDWQKSEGKLTATGHSYGEWTTTKAATCTNTGTQEHTCKKCKKVESETIIVLEHNWQKAYTVDTPATCITAGSESIHCSNSTCSATKDSRTITATGHSLELKNGQAATCNEDGWKGYYECNKCHKLFDAQTNGKEITLDAWKSGDGKLEATGNNKNCTLHEAMVAIDSGKATHYNTLKEAIDAARKVSTGQTATITLLKDVSNLKWLDSQARGDANFTGKWIVGDATGTNVGNKVILDLNGHNISLASGGTIMVRGGTFEIMGTGTISEADFYRAPVTVYGGTDPNQANYSTLIVGKDVILEGYSGIQVKCAQGDATTGGTDVYGVNITVNGKLIGHADAKDSTDVGPGIEVKSDYKNTTGNVPEITLGSTSVVEGVGPGIAAAGYAKWTLSGSVTGKEAIAIKSGEFTISSGTYHATGKCFDPAVSNDGSDLTGAAVSITSDPDYAGNISVTITGGEFTSDHGYAVYEGIGKNNEYNKKTQKSYLDNPLVMSTSKVTSINITGGRFNGNPAKRIADDEVDVSTAIKISMAGKGADAKKVVSGGTFNLNPSDYLVSVKCVEVTTGDGGSSTWTVVASHNIENVAEKAPSCTEVGWNAYVKCSRCDYTTYVEKPALGHDKKNHAAQAPTCTEIGWDAYDTCTRCNYTSKVEKAALGHDEQSHEAKTASCTEIGWNAYVTCSRCSYTTKMEKQATGHSNEKVNGQKATCTVDGWNDYYECSKCKKLFDAQTGGNEIDLTTWKTGVGKLSVIAHTYGSWTITKNATCTETGSKERTCTECSDKQTETIAALGHSLSKVSAKAATYSAAGNSEYYTCSRDCGKYFSDAEGKTEILADSWIISKLTYSGGSSGGSSAAGSAGATTTPAGSVTIKTEVKTETKTDATGTTDASGEKQATETKTVATITATIATETKTATDGTKTVAAKIDTAVAAQIVEAAVENKSEEVVVSAAATPVAETAAGTTTEVAIPAETISQISEKTEAAVTIESEAAKVTLDQKAVAAVAEAAGEAGTVSLVVETVAQDENKVEVDLKLETSSGKVSDFKGGSVSVTVKLNATLAGKPVMCVYIDDNGNYHKVEGTKNADGTFTFKTGHFSTYAIMPEDEANDVIAQQNEKVEGLVKALSLKASSTKTKKGSIKVTLKVDADEIKDIEDLGYTVKYKFYRSTKKSSGYKAKLEKAGKTYTNTSGKKGTRYYYKARVMVYDSEGNLIAKTALKQCKYAGRVR